MKCKRKTTVSHSISSILRSNEGTSIVLVTIIAILIITGVVILRITTSSLWASADKQYNQDQAYVMATTLGTSVDNLIRDNSINLASYSSTVTWNVDSSVITIAPHGEGYLVTVTSKVGSASYVYSAYYAKSGRSGSYTRHIL